MITRTNYKLSFVLHAGGRICPTIQFLKNEKENRSYEELRNDLLYKGSQTKTVFTDSKGEPTK